LFYKLFLRCLYFLALAAYVYLLVDGTSFYLSPYKERPRIEAYRLLRPAGLKGHAFGVIGATFMILMLSYTLRKRIKALRSFGILNRWLDIHIFFGIMGPLLIVLHTTFKVQGLVAVSFWSMVAVATSGIFGRYLYLQIPRNIQGDEIDIKELEETNRQYTAELKKEFNLSDEILQRLEKRDAIGIAENSGAIKVLFTILKDDALRPFRFRHRQRDFAEFKHLPHEARRKIIRIIHRRARLSRRIALFNQVQQLFHYWHVIHKPFAVIMYIVMIVHIVVAIWTGYRWIF